MPRLRIKLPNGATEKLQVEDSCTFQGLKESVIRVICPQSTVNEVTLSLNKKVDIEGQATDSLRSLGICSGDTLWLMSAPQGAQQSSNSHLAESAAEPTLSTQAAMPSTATLDKAAPADSAQPSPSAATDPPSDVHMAEDAAEDMRLMAPDFLQRVIDTFQGAITSAHQLVLLAMHAVLLETGLQLVQQPEGQYALPANLPTSSARLEYSLQQQPDSPTCEVKYISLGSAFACIAASTGVGTTTVNVNLKQHVDLSHISAGSTSQHAAAAFKQLPQLWVELKDGLALKLVASLRQQAGLEPLLGLLALPSDLKHKLLASLQAKDLAALGCCCTELRHTASSDTLWRTLFEREFGYVTHYEETQGGTVGWQRLFARRWVEREEMRAVRQRMHSRRVGPQRMPYGSPQIPPGPPGFNIGGDYDRLPQPFLGGTPGMFGGPLGGSHHFAAQGPPASYFLGGSRSSRGGNFRLH